MTDYLNLQNGWYNGFLQGMGQSGDSFQMLQPNTPLLDNNHADTALWAYFNNIPPDSLTQNYISSGGNQFYDDYRGLMSALDPANTIDIKKDIGKGNFENWQEYVRSLTKPPRINQIAALFRSWALLNAPDVANKGASDYDAILLDPVASAQTELALSYTDSKGLAKPFDWSLNFSDLSNQLSRATSRSFTFQSATMNTDVSGAWTKRSDKGLFGIWGHSSSESSISQMFASSRVTVDARFEHVLTFIATPSDWYSSAAMGLAFANKNGNPWSSTSSLDWANTFGAPNGTMERFMANLIVASGMHVTVTSSAAYSSAQQGEVHNNAHAGLWPFYSSGGGHSATHSVQFSKSGQMTITIDSQPDIPIVLGGNVLSASEFLGHAAESATRLVRLAAAA